MRISYMYSLLLEHPSHPSRLSQNTLLSFLCFIAGSHELFYAWASLMAQKVKNLPAVWETWV